MVVRAYNARKLATFMNCTTHHYACDCRERKLWAVLKPHLTDLKLEGLRGNQVAFQAFIDIDETWRELYGCSIEDDERGEAVRFDDRCPAVIVQMKPKRKRPTNETD